MELSTLNLWAVLAAAVATYGIGAIWYSPLLFSGQWMESAGLRESDLENTNMAKIMSLTLIYSLIMAFCLGMFLNDPSIGLSEGAFYGFLTGFGWIFFVIATNSMYEQKSWTYILIVGGYWTVAFTVMGLILGAWK
ncbi:MAG: DUF1761 domain-containing protein [Balneolaceae bacterium]